MPVKRKQDRAARRQARQEAHRKRIPQAQDGLPSGKHLAGFKGIKTDAVCLCGGCHPKAVANRNKVVYR